MSKTTFNMTYRMSTPKEMRDDLQKEQDKTSKWRFLKRLRLKRSIEFWRKK